MPELLWFDSVQVPDRALLRTPRLDNKPALAGYAMVVPLYPDQAVLTTKVYLEGSNIVADNYDELSIPITERLTFIDAAYDQLARLWCAYVEDGICKLYWYDPIPADFVTTEFGAGTNVQLFMDDLRWEAAATTGNTIFLVYERDSVVYYRLQSDRFLVEYLLVELKPYEHLISAGLNNKYRVQVLLSRELVTEEPMQGELVTYVYVINDVPLSINYDIVAEDIINEYNNPSR